MARKLLLCLLLITLFFPLNAQSNKSMERKRTKANISFISLSYLKAIDQYQFLYDSGQQDSLVLQRLAISNQKVGNMEDAALWYKRLCTDMSKATSEDVYQYAMVLKELSQYERADSLMNRYSEMVHADRSKQQLLNTLPVINTILNTGRGSVSEAVFNTENSDFGAVDYGGGIVFASSRAYAEFEQRKYNWKNQPFLDLYSVKEGFGTLMLRQFSENINSRFHEGPVCFSTDQDEMFFTRNSEKFTKGDSDVEKVSYLQIFSAKKSGDDWHEIVLLPFNSEEFSCGHPSITADGKRLYFVSNRPGGFGGTDIYYSDRTETGWGEPVNLGDVINTPDDEMFPFYDKQGRLFFSSRGHVGIGGLDIFCATPYKDGFGKIINMGVPINSERDDFAFFLKEDAKSGYMASNRQGGTGDDDVYNVEFPMPLIFPQLMIVRIFDKKDNSPIVFADLEIKGSDVSIDTIASDGRIAYDAIPGSDFNIKVDKDGYRTYRELYSFPEDVRDTLYKDIFLTREDRYMLKGIVFLDSITNPFAGVKVTLFTDDMAVYDTITDNNGDFLWRLVAETDYVVQFEKSDFFTKRLDVTTKGRKPGIIDVNKMYNLKLDKIELNAVVEIPNIYYDLGKSDIRPDAAKELDNLVKFLTDNKQIVIELGSHTDSRGKSKYNQYLSQKRAESAVRYLIQNGIDKSRVKAKGYGESKIKNHCKNGVKCPESLHQENRRTEIRIVDIK